MKNPPTNPEAPICLSKSGMADFPPPIPVMVVGDMNGSVVCLVAIRIGDPDPLVKQQPTGPRLAVIFGQKCRQMRTATARLDRCVHGVRGFVANEKEASGCKPTDEKP